MDPIVLGLVSIVVLLGLIMLGVPIAYCLSLLGILGLSVIIGPERAIGNIASASYAMCAQYAWAICPLFVAVGSLANMAGITTEAYTAARLWLGRLPGGLAMATCTASGAFAACSGSTIANAAIFTPIALPEMLKHGYNKKLSVGCIAASGTFAAMIPPSMTMVIYGMITGEPIGKLLIAGIVPGALTLFVYLVGIYLRALKNPEIAPISDIRANWPEKFKSLRGTWGILVIFFVIMGGIYTGWFAPSAAGAVGVFATFLIVVVRRKLNWTGIKTVSLDIVVVAGTILLIIIGGTLFGRFWVMSGFVMNVSQVILGLSVPPIFIILVIMAMFIILGCFLDPPSMMIITLPILYPIVTGLGYSGIWFGILMIKATEIAVITPPLGFNAYVVKAAAGDQVELEDVFAGIFPFLILEFIVTGILIAFPQIALWLPNTMG